MRPNAHPRPFPPGEGGEGLGVTEGIAAHSVAPTRNQINKECGTETTFLFQGDSAPMQLKAPKETTEDKNAFRDNAAQTSFRFLITTKKGTRRVEEVKRRQRQ